MKRFLRWPAASLVVIVGVLFTLTFAHSGTSLKTAHAASSTSPTVSIPSIVHPYHYVSLSAQGFAPGERVFAHVASINGEPSTYLVCDTTGKCTGQISFYGIDLAYGKHTLIAQGATSGREAQAPFTLVTGIGFAQSQGGVGTAIEVDGAAFTPNETVNVYWGSPSPATFVGSATCDQAGTFAFTNKANNDVFVATGAPGPHQVTVVRQNHTSALLTQPTVFTATFYLYTPKILAPANIKISPPGPTTVAGFGANETVIFSWNANGGQVLGTAQTDYMGRAGANLSYPAVPSGSYILTAKGETSGVTATDTLNTGANIQIAIPATPLIFPAETLPINGGGFTPNQKVQVYFQTTQNDVVTATADATGAFYVSLTLPATYNPTTSYHIYAMSSDGTQHAEAPISFSPPDVSQSIPHARSGVDVPVQGDNFAVGETVAIYWNYGQSNQLLLGTTTVDTSGEFLTTIIVPNDPYGIPATLAAVGQASHLVATQTVTPSPGLVL